MAGAGPVEFVRLTGPPAAATGLAETSFLPDKRFQLLAYLAYDSGWVGRERAAFLFWPDSDTATSRQNLRGLLKRLRTLPFTPEIEVTNHQLRWQVPTDLSALEGALRLRDTPALLASYRGPLLKGLESDESGEFGEWLEIEREALYGRWRAAVLSRLGDLGPGDGPQAAELVRRLLEEDPLDEEAVRAFLEVAARVGDPAAASQVFREFTATLERETGLEPTSATVAAFNAARTAEPARPYDGPDRRAPVPVHSATAPVEPAVTRSPRTLPVLQTSFVGREEEIAEVTAALADPSCRLLTVTGPGGMGKTRLALAVAHRSGDTPVFVPLDTVATVEGFLPAVAASLGLGHVQESALRDAITAALAEDRTLLVLDNFEHILEAAPTLADVLEAAPLARALVTSRERLGLDAEWVFPLGGLDYPANASGLDSVEEFGAVRLFLDRARRVRPGFSLATEDMPAVERFFAVTRGMPLAIELAAVWLRALTIEDLVAEVEAGLDLLETTAPDAQARHGSIRSVFEQSWSRLTDKERSALAKLTVFARPVRPEAAVYVTSANRVTFAALVDKSLLRLDATGRYDLHPLLLQFVREKLAQRTEERLEAERRHAAYYLRFLRERTDAAFGPSPAKVIEEVHAERGELRAAWRAAAEREDVGTVISLMKLLELDIGYYLARGHDDESLSMLATAAESVAAAGDAALAGDLRGRLGDVYGINRGDHARALTEYRAALDFARVSGNVGREAVFRSLIGVTESYQDTAVGMRELDAAMELMKGSEDGLSVATVLDHRAYVLAQSGDFVGARDHYRQLLRSLDDAVGAGAHPYEAARRRFFATMNMGAADFMLGDVSEGLTAREHALGIATEMGNEIWEAHARLELGEMYSSLGEHERAQVELATARSLYLDNNVTAQLSKIDRMAKEFGYVLGDRGSGAGSSGLREGGFRKRT